MLAGHGGACVEQRSGLFETIVNVEQPFAIAFGRPVGHGYDSALLRACIDVGDIARAHGASVAQKCPLHGHVRERGEEAFVIDLHLAVGQQGGVYVLIDALHLIGVGIRHSVGRDETVVAEILVGRVGALEVAAVGIYGLPFGSRPAYRLVNEVPDEAALIFGIFAYNVPIFLKSALGVTHCVGILTLYQRLGAGGIGRVFLACVIGIIHGAEYIGQALQAGPFILHGACRVHLLDELVGLFKVRSVAGLVAERPDDDRGMIAVGCHIAGVALKCGDAEGRMFGKSLVLIAHAVRLDICLGHQIDAIAVAEVIPARVIGIVAGAYGVDVELLHAAYVLNHTFHRHHISAVGVKFVAVGTLDENGQTVDKQLTVLDFDVAKTDIDTYYLRLTLARSESGGERVESRRLGRPSLRARHLNGH